MIQGKVKRPTKQSQQFPKQLIRETHQSDQSKFLSGLQVERNHSRDKRFIIPKQSRESRTPPSKRMTFLHYQIDQQRDNPKFQPKFKRNLYQIEGSKNESHTRRFKLPNGKSTLSQSHILIYHTTETRQPPKRCSRSSFSRIQRGQHKLRESSTT